MQIKIGALKELLLRTFPEEYKIDVSDIPARLAADESAHSDQMQLKERLRAIALKPRQNYEYELKIAKIAHEKGVPYLC